MFVIPEAVPIPVVVLYTTLAGMPPAVATPLNELHAVLPSPIFNVLESVAHPGSPDAKTVPFATNSALVALLNCILGYFGDDIL
jgi:hypothetical protein